MILVVWLDIMVGKTKLRNSSNSISAMMLNGLVVIEFKGYVAI